MPTDQKVGGSSPSERADETPGQSWSDRGVRVVDPFGANAPANCRAAFRRSRDDLVGRERVSVAQSRAITWTASACEQR